MKKICLPVLFCGLFLYSCKDNDKDDLLNKVKFKVLGNVLGGEYSDYSRTIFTGFKDLDTISPKSLSSLFTVKDVNKPILLDSFFIYPYSSELNKVEVCCKYDTTIIFTEVIRDKKYLLVPLHIEELRLFNIYEDINNELNYTKSRPTLDIPTWGVKIGDFVNSDMIEEKIEENNSGGGYQKTITRLLKNDNEIEVSTINLNNSNRLMISGIKRTLSEKEFTDFFDFIKQKYPFLKIIESKGKSSVLNEVDYEINWYGLNLNFRKIKYDFGEIGTKIYFQISDNYIITKEIISKGTKEIKYKPSIEFIQ